jgi:hypothetical protein
MKYVFILIVALALVMTACTGTAPTKLPGDKTADTAVKETTTTTTTTGKTLKDIFASKTLKYTADYTLTTDKSTDQITQVFDLPKYAMITKDSRTIFDGTTMTACTQANNEWQCFKMPVQQSQTEKVEASANEGTTTTIGTCTIAGLTGTKYEVTAKDATKSQVCYTNDGILLEMTSGTTSMVATKVSRTIDNSVFTAPAEAQDLSGLMKNIPQP